MMIQRLLTTLILSFFLLQSGVGAATGNEQATADSAAKPLFQGRVLDGSGNPIESVSLRLSKLPAGDSIEIKSDAEGAVMIPQLAVGHYEIRITHPDFEDQTQQVDWEGGLAPLVFTLQPRSLRESVTVTATRNPQPLANIPSTIVVVGPADLQRSPAVTLDDTLRQIPAFSLFRRSSSLVAHPTTQGVSLRGIGPSGVSRTLVLWDGTPLNDPFGGWVYWSQLDKTSLDRVEVSPGGGSSLYGSSALGGVIQLFSKAPESNRIELDLQGGTQATAGGDILAAYHKNAWSGNFSGMFLHTDGYFIVAPENRGLVDDRAASVRYALRTSNFYKPAADSQLFLHLTYFAEDRQNGTILQTNETDIATVRLGYRKESANHHEWQAYGFGLLEKFKGNFTAISADRSQEFLTQDQVVPARGAGGSVLWTGLLFARHLFTSGLDWQLAHGNSEELSYTAGSPSRYRVGGGSQQLGGIFVQDLFNPTNRWMIQLGARLDGWTNYDAQRRDLIFSTGSQTDTLFVTQRRGTVSPKVGVSYHLHDNITLRGSYYQSFRAPTLNELYRSFRVGNVLTQSNDLLGSEKIKGFEAGADWRVGQRLSGHVVGFWNQLENPVSNITLSATPALITRQRQNLGEAKAQGLETEASFRLNQDWSFRGAYLLSDSKVTQFSANPLLESNWLPQVPRHRVTASFNYFNARRLEAFVVARFVGNQFDDDLNLLPLGNFTVLDFYLSRQIKPRARLYFSAENLFNRQFLIARTPIESIGAPRMLHGGIKLAF